MDENKKVGDVDFDTFFVVAEHFDIPPQKLVPRTAVFRIFMLLASYAAAAAFSVYLGWVFFAGVTDDSMMQTVGAGFFGAALMVVAHRWALAPFYDKHVWKLQVGFAAATAASFVYDERLDFATVCQLLESSDDNLEMFLDSMKFYDDDTENDTSNLAKL